MLIWKIQHGGCSALLHALSTWTRSCKNTAVGTCQGCADACASLQACLSSACPTVATAAQRASLAPAAQADGLRGEVAAAAELGRARADREAALAAELQALQARAMHGP